MFQLKQVHVNGILKIDSLTIAKHKVTCITGPSGSGKTTLLRLLNHLNSPTSGTIFYEGSNVHELNPVELRRQIVMFQQTPIIFDGTVQDNLLVGRHFAEKETNLSKETLSKYLHLVHLQTELDKDATLLSGGEKQRLSLARVLLMEPTVLLLDEPTSSLDEETAEIVMQRLINHVNEQAITLIMITHSNHLVETVAEEVIDLTPYSLANVKKEDTK
ncbi:ATP-binding cassette domain-containing protein [Bacillus sp. JCM 19034]|uniref:ABC transporter ATP-binding protein n=1 Tax=Bacillus sp. JCM 19034 TaxID=1481928 RepID=UPI0007818EE4|nr:ABC transporter ATP-binding protein [Bacillus sp. JCM 19034]